MTHFHDYGRDAEERAAIWLREIRGRPLRSVDIIARNYRTRRGEIDLILEETSLTGRIELVFVEVRARRCNAMVGALDSVGGLKRYRIQKTAQSFLAKYRPQPGRTPESMRFDILGWDGRRWNHLSNAWLL